jgi:hypothetical protein
MEKCFVKLLIIELNIHKILLIYPDWLSLMSLKPTELTKLNRDILNLKNYYKPAQFMEICYGQRKTIRNGGVVSFYRVFL